MRFDDVIAYYPAEEGIALCPDCAPEHAARRYPEGDDPTGKLDPEREGWREGPDGPVWHTLEGLDLEGPLEDGNCYGVAFAYAEAELRAPTCDHCGAAIEGFTILCCPEYGFTPAECECPACREVRAALDLDRREVLSDTDRAALSTTLDALAAGRDLDDLSAEGSPYAEPIDDAILYLRNRTRDDRPDILRRFRHFAK